MVGRNAVIGRVMTDTFCMNESIGMITTRAAAVAVALLALVALPASAGGPCGHCGHSACGRDYGGTGCGPRYWGAVHEDPHCVDPCDGCARWRGCHGVRQPPDMLVPWQLPPGRGFLSAEQVGWVPGPCMTCGPGSSSAPCGSCGPCGNSVLAKKPWRPCRSIIEDVRPNVAEWGYWFGSVWPW